MKGPLPVRKGHWRHRQEQTKPERNTCTNPTYTHRDIGTNWHAMEESGAKGDCGKPCDGEDRVIQSYDGIVTHR